MTPESNHRTLRTLLIGVLTAFSLVGAQSASTASEPNSTPFPLATAQSTGLDPGALTRLSEKVRSYLVEEQIVGAELLVIKDRKTVLHETYGWRDREAELEMTPGTIFNIRSMTKPLTGAAVQMLIDEGRLALEDPVAKYLPGFARPDEQQAESVDEEKDASAITIEHLLTHRSGLPVTILTSIDQYPSLIDMANAIGQRGPQFPPGSRFWYSDPGTDVLGAVVEVVSGKSLTGFWQERILGPLGMDDTWVPLDARDQRWQRLATSYIGSPGQWTAFWTPSDGDPLYPYAWGSQTLYGTPHDYAKFLALWLDGGLVAGAGKERRLLSEAAIDRTLTPVSEATGMGSTQRMPTGFAGLEPFYGQMAVLWAESLEAEPRVIGHSGSDGTFAWAWPEQDLMVLYFTQSRGGISGLSLERWIDELLVGSTTAGDQVSARSSAELERLYQEIQGEYLADFGSLRNTTIAVKLTGGRPALDLGYGRIVELRDPDEQGKWAFAINERSAVSFGRNRAGQVDALRLHEGSWKLEAPRKGMPIEGETDPARLDDMQRVAGTYRVLPESSDGLELDEQDGEASSIELVVQVEHGHLTVDKSQLPVKLPRERFALLPADENGMRRYRANDRLAALFEESDEGNVRTLRIFQDGEEKFVAERTSVDISTSPPVDQVLALLPSLSLEQLKALGGVRMSGTATLEQTGASGSAVSLAVGLDRYRSTTELGTLSVVEIVNRYGAAVYYGEREVVHQGAHLQQARLAHPLQRFADWRTVYEGIEVLSSTSLQGRQVFRLRTTKGDTSPIVHFIDAETGDVLRTESVTLAVTGDLPTTTRYADFREIAGLRFPHRITTSTQLTGDLEIEYQEIETGLDLKEEHFELK